MVHEIMARVLISEGFHMEALRGLLLFLKNHCVEECRVVTVKLKEAFNLVPCVYYLLV